MVDIASTYGHALVAIVVYALLSNVLNAMVGIRKGARKMQPGASFSPAAYDNPDWRLERSQLNSVEMGGFSLAMIIAGILAGGAPFWVNLFATLILLARLGMTFIYMRGVGAGYMGPRTWLAIVTTVSNFGLGLLVLAAVF